MKKHCVKILEYKTSSVYSKWFYTSEEASKYFDECVGLISNEKYPERTAFCVMRFNDGILMYFEDIIVGVS